MNFYYLDPEDEEFDDIESSADEGDFPTDDFGGDDGSSRTGVGIDRRED